MGTAAQGVTILHVSDPQFGQYHRFSASDSFGQGLIRDLRRLTDRGMTAPDLMILSGDITERADEDEFADALAFIDEICTVTGLVRDRVVVVPGNHDVSWGWSEVYFAECKARKINPAVPYAPKWRNYREFVTELHGPMAFTEERPYRLHIFDDLRVAVAAMNSTINESHHPEDHYGWCGDEQLRWFADQLGEVDGMLRIGALHHNARRKAVADNENLRDEDALTTILRGSLDLLLHGHTHEGKEDRLADGTLVLATGSAAITAEWRPGETPNQYQVLQIGPGGITRWARQWDGTQDWMPDPRADPDRHREKVRIRRVIPGWRQRKPDPADDGPTRELDLHRPDFSAQVELTTRRDLGEQASVDLRAVGDPPLRYLLATTVGKPIRCVGIVDGPLDAETLTKFDQRVFTPLRSRQPECVIVHHGPDDPALRENALRAGIRVKTWAEYNDLLESSAYRGWLQRELNTDPLYPQDLYQRQRYRDINRWGGAASDVHGDLLEQVSRVLLDEDGRFVLVLGDAGYGKSFLVRRLAHQILANDKLGITPIIIYLRDRDRRQTLEEMVSDVLIPSRSVFLADRFQHSLEAGTLALLIDGYDEFAVRVGYDSAAALLRTFVDAMRGRAKIVLTTRPNHFRSTDQATSQLFDSLRTVHQGRVYLLEPFDEDQQRAFLTRWFELKGDPEPAALAGDWMSALSRVDNLPELARTPRMLSFIVEDLTLQEIASASDRGTVTAADLYDRLVTRWLGEEAVRIDAGGKSTVSSKARRTLLEEIALRLWQAGERDVTETALQRAACDVINLPQLELTADQAAQIAGSRTLLRVDDQRWKFAHQSVWEFLLASRLATLLQNGADDALLGEAPFTSLTIRFLRDLAPEAALHWVSRISGDDHE